MTHTGGHQVGEIINGRELVAYCGLSANRRPRHTWKWRCPGCGQINGPSYIHAIKQGSFCRTGCSRACPEGCKCRKHTGGNARRRGPTGGHEVGDVLNERQLTEYCGLSKNDAHLWKWRCLKCGGSDNGPSTIGSIMLGGTCLRGCFRGHNYSGHEEFTGSFLNKLQRQATAGKRSFDWFPDMSREEWVRYLWGLLLAQNRRCAYTGIELQLGKRHRKAHGITASLDRIDNSRGYVVGNVQWVHKEINWMKGTFSDAEFRTWCEAVTRHCEKRN